MEWPGPGSRVLTVVNNATIHRKLESKSFSSTPGKLWLPFPSFILGFKMEPYKSWVSLSEQTIIYNELNALKIAFY